jgi:hypothetical protein
MCGLMVGEPNNGPRQRCTQAWFSLQGACQHEARSTWTPVGERRRDDSARKTDRRLRSMSGRPTHPTTVRRYEATLCRARPQLGHARRRRVGPSSSSRNAHRTSSQWPLRPSTAQHVATRRPSSDGIRRHSAAAAITTLCDLNLRQRGEGQVRAAARTRSPHSVRSTRCRRGRSAYRSRGRCGHPGCRCPQKVPEGHDALAAGVVGVGLCRPPESRRLISPARRNRRHLN